MDGEPLAGRFREDGHVVVPAVLDEPALARIRRHLVTVELLPSGLAAVDVGHDSEARLIASDDRLAAVVRAVLGPASELFGYTYLVKAPHEGLPVLWHQDGHPWREQLGVEEALTVWVAIDAATPANGCLRVIPGSHRLELSPLRLSESVPNVFGWEADPAIVNESAAIDVPLQRGDVSIHHPALLHSSGPNTTTHPRAALALRFRL